MNNGAFAYKNNHGRRTISIQERTDANIWLDSFIPKTNKEQRDKIILTLFIKDNLSAQAIVRLRHPDIVSVGNRSKGKPLTVVGVLNAIYEYFPQFKNRHDKKQKPRERIDLQRKREKYRSPHPKVCSHCGSHKELEEHHMIPLMFGGTNDDANLVYLCKSCHRIVTTYQMKLLNTKKAKEIA